MLIWRCIKKTLLQADSDFVFENKAILRKSEDQLFLNNRVIAYCENQLSHVDKAGFEKELTVNAALVDELALVLKTRLSADLSVVYPNKATLKKKARVIVLFSTGNLRAMAAAFALLIGMAIVFNIYSKRKQSGPDYANKTIPGTLKPAPETRHPNLNAAIDKKTIAHKSAFSKGSQDKNQLVKSKELPAVQENSPLAVQQSPAVKDTVSSVPNKQTTVEHIADIKQDTRLDLSAETLLAETAAPQHPVNFLEESVDDEPDTDNPGKNGFWKKAVTLAKRVNHLGLKSVDGVEKPNSNFSLSFNAFSVERR